MLDFNRRIRKIAAVTVGVAAILYICAVYHVSPREKPVAAILEKVYDGDTVAVRGYGRCRILGIDTPEIWRFENGKWTALEHPADNAFAAKNWLETFLQQEVGVRIRGKDKYERWLIVLTLPGGIDAADYIRQHNWEKRKR